MTHSYPGSIPGASTQKHRPRSTRVKTASTLLGGSFFHGLYTDENTGARHPVRTGGAR
jgi:hypothetical protein